VRSDDFSFSIRAGFVFHGARTGYGTSGSARRGSLAHLHHAGRIEIPGKSSDFTASGSILDITAERGISVAQLATLQLHPPLLSFLRLSFYNP
jgi:hypothetical protein